MIELLNLVFFSSYSINVLKDDEIRLKEETIKGNGDTNVKYHHYIINLTKDYVFLDLDCTNRRNFQSNAY